RITWSTSAWVRPLRCAFCTYSGYTLENFILKMRCPLMLPPWIDRPLRTPPPATSAAVHDAYDTTAIEAEFRRPGEFQQGPGGRTARDVGSEAATIGDAGGRSPWGEFEAGETLLAFAEQRAGLLGEASEFIDAAGGSGENVARIILEAHVVGQHGQHAVHVEAVVSRKVTFDQ